MSVEAALVFPNQTIRNPAIRESVRQRFSVEASALASVVRRHSKRLPTRVLVVGCGNGEQAAQLAISLDADVTGVERTACFDRAAEAYATLRAADLSPLGFADGAFDFVYSNQNFESIPALRSTLSEMRRVLKAGGGFCLKLPVARLGFTAPELRSELIATFGEATDVTSAYYEEVHNESSPLFRGWWRSRLGSSFVPARYFIGKRSQSQARAA